MILVSASASADPNSNENASESYHAEGKATCLQTYTPQSRYKCVDRKTKCDQGDSEFANLLDDTLCCTIVPSHDDAIVGPPDIEGATYCLQNVE